MPKIKHMNERDQKIIRYISKITGYKTTADLLGYVTRIHDAIAKQSKQEVYGDTKRDWSVDLAPESEIVLNKLEDASAT